MLVINSTSQKNVTNIKKLEELTGNLNNRIKCELLSNNQSIELPTITVIAARQRLLLP